MRKRKWYSKKNKRERNKEKETVIHTCKFKDNKQRNCARRQKESKRVLQIMKKKPKILYKFCRSLFPA